MLKPPTSTSALSIALLLRVNGRVYIHGSVGYVGDLDLLVQRRSRDLDQDQGVWFWKSCDVSRSLFGHSRGDKVTGHSQ